MRRASGFKKQPKRALGFEKNLVDQALAKAMKEVRHREFAESENERKVRKRREEKALKLARRIRSAEKQLEVAMSQPLGPYEDAYLYTYERHMPIRVDNEAWRKAITRVYLTHDELWAIVNNPELFPNPRLVFSFLSGQYRVDIGEDRPFLSKRKSVA